MMPTQCAFEPLPWSEDGLKKAASTAYLRARENVKEHPAYDVIQRLDSVTAALRIFNNSATSFFTTLKQFEVEVSEKGLLNRSRRF